MRYSVFFTGYLIFLKKEVKQNKTIYSKISLIKRNYTLEYPFPLEC